MKHEQIRQAITFLGIEDFSGLWEIGWERGLYEMAAEDRSKVSRRAIQELLSEGIVKLYRCHEPDGELVEIDKDEWEQVLSEPLSWQEPALDTISIRFGTTAEGREAYWAAARK